jgi:hypothetical protein
MYIDRDFFQREIEPHAEFYCPVCDGVGVCEKNAGIGREWRIGRYRVILLQRCKV